MRRFLAVIVCSILPGLLYADEPGGDYTKADATVALAATKNLGENASSSLSDLNKLIDTTKTNYKASKDALNTAACNMTQEAYDAASAFLKSAQSSIDSADTYYSGAAVSTASGDTNYAKALVAYDKKDWDNTVGYCTTANGYYTTACGQSCSGAISCATAQDAIKSANSMIP